MKNFRSNALSPSLLCTMGLALMVLLVPLPHAHAEPSCTWRFTASGGTVTDHNTQLVWQQDMGMTGGTSCTAVQSNGCYSKAEALTYCDNLSLAGGGWRLPTIFELQTIMEDDGFVDQQFQPGVAFWSSTTYRGAPGGNFGWYTFEERMGYAPDTEGYHVRCVR